MAAYLDTFSFQSVGIYTRAGYEIFGTLEHFPIEHSRHFFERRYMLPNQRSTRTPRRQRFAPAMGRRLPWYVRLHQ